MAIFPLNFKSFVPDFVPWPIFSRSKKNLKETLEVTISLSSTTCAPCSTFQVREDKYYRAETQRFDLDWTYGVAWGAVCFMIGAAVLFLIRTETQEVTQHKDNTPPPYYLNYTQA